MMISGVKEKEAQLLNQQLQEVLNKQVADWTLLFVKLHNFHWFVKGAHFFTLHAKFEELYNEAALHIDNIAERLLALGGKPVATMKGSMEIARLQEAKGNESAEQMVASIAADFNNLVNDLKQGMELAQSDNDETTADLLLTVQKSLEKHIWLLQSFLGQ